VQRCFFTLNDFAVTPPAGNPLAVVTDDAAPGSAAAAFAGVMRSASIGGSAAIVSSRALDL
jgi:hypothetical protein